MEPSTEQENLSEAVRPSTRAASLDSDALNKFARSYFANDFPNSQRQDCPTPEALNSFIHDGKIPDDELRAHLFGCSECFRDFHTALKAHRAEMEAVAPGRTGSWWDSFIASLKPPQVFAALALMLLISVLVGVYLIREYRKASEPSVAQRESLPVVAPPENSSRNNLPSATPQTSPSNVAAVVRTRPVPTPKPNNRQTEPMPRPQARPSNQGQLIALSIVEIDLGNYAITRGGTGSTEEIKLPPSRTRLLLTLPEGSDKGLYTVSIVDAQGNTLMTDKASSTDGKILTVTLNAQDLTPGKLSLRIAREGESLVTGIAKRSAPRPLTNAGVATTIAREEVKIYNKGTIVVLTEPGATIALESVQGSVGHMGTLPPRDLLAFFNNLPPGRYRVAAKLKGYLTAEKEVVVVAGELARVILNLRPIVDSVPINVPIVISTEKPVPRF